MCMIEDAEFCTIWNVTNPKARKSHTCTECGRTIEAAEQYMRIESLYDGFWSTQRVCSHCKVGADWLTKECHGFLAGGILEDIRQHAEEYRSFGLWRIIAGSDLKWKYKSGRTMPVPAMPRLSAPHTDDRVIGSMPSQTTPAIETENPTKEE